MPEKVYKFHNLVKPIRGFNSSAIFDLHRLDWYIIPNSMYDFVTQNEFKNLDKCIQKLDSTEDRETVEYYFRFLLENELIFKIDSDEVKLFPKVIPNYYIPETITNTVLHLKENLFKDIRLIVTEIEKTGCKHYQLKLDFLVEKKHLGILENLFFNSSANSVEIIIKELDESINKNEVLTFVANVGRVKNLFIYQSKKNNIIKSNTNLDNIIFLKSEINFNEEIVTPNNFVVNQFSFSESLHHNLYFNKKLYIDTLGNIKNSNFSRTYGNIFDNNLVSIINSNEFQGLWYITKDQIDICSDCEFRNVCVDYRIPITGKEVYYYEDSKACGYNPYIAKWQNEEGWISVEQWRIMNPIKK